LVQDSLSPLPWLYKGLALFTPGEDLIYCVDPTKQGLWHHHLCSVLQELLDLPEPPLFLTPCFTATIDCWFDAHTQQLQLAAEAYPLVLRHQAILNTIFETPSVAWQPAACPQGLCDPLVLNSYRQQFPQLWQHHNLVIKVTRPSASPMLADGRAYALHSHDSVMSPPAMRFFPEPVIKGYVLRLFVAGHSHATEETLESLHQLLGQSLNYPYTLKVIDVIKQPEQAEADQVTATPTLVKVWPKPVRRLVGNLDNLDKLLRILDPLEI
jgi:circadian clock protein KaiB